MASLKSKSKGGAGGTSKKTVDAGTAIQTAKSRSVPVVDFGCPAVDWPHHIRVVIPAGRQGDIHLTEDFGILGHASGRADETERCSIPRPRWNAMAEVAKAELNARLREKKLPTSRWKPGENRVERILGTEILTLAWAVEAADEVDVPAVIAAWVSLHSSERLWLAGRILANPDERVRRGLALMLAGTPLAPAEKSPRKKNAPVQKGICGLPLFGDI